jgi:hypothetical protein
MHTLRSPRSGILPQLLGEREAPVALARRVAHRAGIGL